MNDLTKHLPALYGHYEMRHEADQKEYWDRAKNAQLVRRHNLEGAPMQPTAVPAINALVARHGANIVHGDHVAHMKNLPWRFGDIVMPVPESFTAPHVYSHTVLHEMSHRARAMKYGPRMDLAGDNPSEMERSPGYIMEECEAELGAALVAAELDPDNAEYHLTRGAQYVGFFADGVKKQFVDGPDRATIFKNSLPSALERANLLLGERQPMFDIEGWAKRTFNQSIDDIRAELEPQARAQGIA